MWRHVSGCYEGYMKNKCKIDIEELIIFELMWNVCKHAWYERILDV
jgi:hypothetical protein